MSIKLLSPRPKTTNTIYRVVNCEQPLWFRFLIKMKYFQTVVLGIYLFFSLDK